jgi:hypothetical protein
VDSDPRAAVHQQPPWHTSGTIVLRTAVFFAPINGMPLSDGAAGHQLRCRCQAVDSALAQPLATFGRDDLPSRERRIHGDLEWQPTAISARHGGTGSNPGRCSCRKGGFRAAGASLTEAAGAQPLVFRCPKAITETPSPFEKNVVRGGGKTTGCQVRGSVMDAARELARNDYAERSRLRTLAWRRPGNRSGAASAGDPWTACGNR